MVEMLISWIVEAQTLVRPSFHASIRSFLPTFSLILSRSHQKAFGRSSILPRQLR